MAGSLHGGAASRPFDVTEMGMRTGLELAEAIPCLRGDLHSLCLSYVSFEFRFSHEVTDTACRVTKDGTVVAKVDESSASCGVLGTPVLGPGVTAFWKIAVDCSLDEMYIGVVDRKELAVRSVRDLLWDKNTRHYEGMWAYCDGSRKGSSSFGCGPTVFPAYHDSGDYHTGDTISLYVDFDRKLMKVGKNGRWQVECRDLVSATGEFIPYVQLVEEGDQVTLQESVLAYKHKGPLVVADLKRRLKAHLERQRL
mmetsp:Transcript_4006/g.7712  ORF Transcript_4006/g.7712 Transcript_4006/m.7712 type:complete len:253 (-) Transcript_4006:500-1258(-)